MKRTMVIVSHALELGGAERSLIGFLEALDESKWEIDLFLLRQEGELMEVLLDRINLLFFQYYDDFCLDLRKQPPELYAEYRDEIRDACPFLLITDETESEI